MRQDAHLHERVAGAPDLMSPAVRETTERAYQKLRGAIQRSSTDCPHRAAFLAELQRRRKMKA